MKPLDETLLKKLWLLPDGEPAFDALPPMTETQLCRFVDQFSVELPVLMVQLYRLQNGGFADRFQSSFWSIGIGENTDCTSLQKLCKTYHDDEELEQLWSSLLGDLSNVIVFLGDGHFYFTLNYNQVEGDEPIIWFVDENGAQSTGQNFESWIRSYIESD